MWMKLMSGSDIYSAVEHIKTIVKQLTGDKADNFSNKAAGTLTNSTLEARKNIYTVNHKKLGHFYFYCNFGKCWSIFKILSLSESEINGEH